MKNKNTQAKHHPGILPHLQEAEQGVRQWIKGLKLIGQHFKNKFKIQASEQRRDEKGKSID